MTEGKKYSLTLELYVTPNQALALATFLKNIDCIAIDRYSHKDDAARTALALHALRDALKEVGFSPR